MLFIEPCPGESVEPLVPFAFIRCAQSRVSWAFCVPRYMMMLIHEFCAASASAAVVAAVAVIQRERPRGRVGARAIVRLQQRGVLRSRVWCCGARTAAVLTHPYNRMLNSALFVVCNV